MTKGYRYWALSAALVFALTAGLTTIAAAHDKGKNKGRGNGNYRNFDTREYGYNNGYREGWEHGRNDRARRIGYDLDSRVYKDADHGYQKHMGPRGQYRQGFKDGYKEGYDDAYRGRAGNIGNIWGRDGVWRRGDDDDRWRRGDDDYWRRGDRDYRRDDDSIWSRGGGSGAGQYGYRNGYRDGIEAGVSERRDGKSYSPYNNPRYQDGDHDYRSSYGDKDDYKQAYRQAYLRGYEEGYGRRR